MMDAVTKEKKISGFASNFIYMFRGTDFPFQIFPFSVSEFNKFRFFPFSILYFTDVFSISLMKLELFTFSFNN